MFHPVYRKMFWQVYSSCLIICTLLYSALEMIVRDDARIAFNAIIGSFIMLPGSLFYLVLFIVIYKFKRKDKEYTGMQMLLILVATIILLLIPCSYLFSSGEYRTAIFVTYHLLAGVISWHITISLAYWFVKKKLSHSYGELFQRVE